LLSAVASSSLSLDLWPPSERDLEPSAAVGFRPPGLDERSLSLSLCWSFCCCSAPSWLLFASALEWRRGAG
jgi:hypothetical protein